MFEQLARLTRPVPGLAPGALAVAVYAEPDGRGGFTARPAVAPDRSLEGVACVDDAARAAVVHCAVWRGTRSREAHAAAAGLLRFVLAMQGDGDDGRPANFLLDWDGRVNRHGETSRPGGAWWTARAMHALACAAATFGPRGLAPDLARRVPAALERGLRWLGPPRAGEELGPRAIAVLAALRWWEATGDDRAARRCLRWAEHLAASRTGEILPDQPGRAQVHLWGHLQEVALARAGSALDRPDLVAAAHRSAAAVLAAPAECAFTDRRVTIPYDVSCTVLGLTAVAAATGDRRLAHLADLARAWFTGRNAARQPVYDRDRGCVYDGIEDGQVSANSGAESNVEGAFALGFAP